MNEVNAERTGSAKTEELYLDILADFCRFMNISPHGLIETAKRELLGEMKGALQSKTWAEKKTLDYFNFLVNNGWARTSAKTSYGALRSFFRHNGIIFRGKTPQATARTKSLQYTDEDLRRAWRAAPLEEKLPLGVLRSTG